MWDTTLHARLLLLLCLVTKEVALDSRFRVFGFRVLGLRGLGFRGLGF